MNNPERLPSETHKPITGYLWGGLAVLTCPCHLPILAVVLAGTITVLRDRLVALAISRTDLFSRWCIRRTLPIMAMVINPHSPTA